MFQVDGGRSVAIQPLQPAATMFGAETPTVVADNLDELLGEQLLPLRARTGQEDEPHLLAVDAAGQPVVVEIVPVLDEAACLRALRYAGRAARMSTQDLARSYRGGPDRFTSHLAAFRETVPATSLLSTTVRPGSRLLLVCARISDDVADALEFLLQPGWQVQLLQVGVVPGADGRRIVDVSPLTRRVPARRAMEPTPLRLVRPTTGLTVTAERARAPGRDQERGPARPDVRDIRSVTPSEGTSAIDPAAAPHRDPATVARPAPKIVPPPFGRPFPPPVVDQVPTALADPPRTAPSPSTASAPVRTAVLPQTQATRSPAAGAQDDAPYAFTGRVPAPVAAHPRLLEITQEVGEPVPLVWTRERRGRTYEATLRTDGLIELADGSRHADPGAAARRASGADHDVDGWRLWRLGDASGPTLGEALGL